ncbi:xylosidase [Coraliomargarita sinensis]|uniref:Xylosidase n=2 Tax=Coraliomargarita sinensis TaxID=2174842 RepID=A0A317ZID4_9BACT|nr:xylosidase [Coraliomargarita sinensis]
MHCRSRPAVNLGPQEGVMRRDPSDIIKVGDTYYVWYSKGSVFSGYDATIWYAVSKDGRVWEEKSMALGRGTPGGWDGASVFTPNILVAEGKYWLFYSGTSVKLKDDFNPNTKIGVAVSDSPDGPWKRVHKKPVLKNSDQAEAFDSHLVDDACLIIRGGKYWLYYKGRQLGKSPRETKMGIAFAENPAGPYRKCGSNPVIPGGHEVLVWPQGPGVAAVIGNVGPKGVAHSIQYARDGVNFSKKHELKEGPWAGGAYRPDGFEETTDGDRIRWGLQIGKKKGSLPFLERFEFHLR